MKTYDNQSPKQLNSPAMIQRELVDVLKLPQTTLMKFDGDPMQYWIFMNSFNSCVHNFNVTDGDKLNRLF